jgi:hypothetical protein
MNTFRYDCDLIGGSLMVRECRFIAELLLKNISADEWAQIIYKDNILQKRTLATSIRIARAVRMRLERLEPPFWRAICDGDEELATQVAFCAALERNLLLMEFIETVLKDAYITRSEILETYHWNEFLDDRSHRDSSIANWTESSRKKMAQVVYRMLAEVGFLHSTRNMRLRHILVRPEVKILLEDSYRTRIRACLDVSTSTLQH